jgi:hypothetical protein
VISLLLLALFVFSLRQSKAFALSRTRGKLTGKLSRFLILALASFPVAIVALISHNYTPLDSPFSVLVFFLGRMPCSSELTRAPYSGSLQQAILS